MLHSKRNVLVFVTLLSFGFLAFAQHAVIKNVPAKWTPAVSGSAMYQQYCAVCHGDHAKGNGPLASALKNAPPDLTTMAKANGGKYPAAHVVSILRFGAAAPSHGTAEMPVWGPVFKSMNKSNTTEALQRTSNLSRYLETLQVK
jgi:mono/diheme cytochrome c family protein